MSSNTNSTATKDESTPALVPKLRFPGFQDDWEMTPIGEKVDLLSGYPFDGPDICEDRSGVRLLRGINITEGRIRHSPEIDRYYTGETDGLEKFRVCLNDLVIGMDGSKVGKNSSLISDDDADALLIQRVARLRTSSPTLIQFIFQQINSTTFHSYVDKINTSSGIPHISAKQIKEFTVGFPSPAEQQKIAECLSSVDELVAAQARKLDALKTHKKGLMQQLFPREGETQPRLRFPEFLNAGQWVMRTMGSFASFSSGGTPSKDNPAYWNGSIPWISASSMYDLIIEKADHYVSPLAIGNGTRIAKKGSLLILVRGSMLFKRGPICIAGIDVAFNQDVKALDVETSINTSFLLYQLSAFQSRIPINETGIGAGKIELEHLKGFELFFPKVPEQQRIADCLTSLDGLIAAQTQKLEALKTHKKGLMQQLFPSLEEVEA